MVMCSTAPEAPTIIFWTATYQKYLTKVIDKLLYNTKAKSSIEIKGEFAQLVPGSPNAIENNGQAVSFIDDFASRSCF